jgi:hypothetical protein
MGAALLHDGGRGAPLTPPPPPLGSAAAAGWGLAYRRPLRAAGAAPPALRASQRVARPTFARGPKGIGLAFWAPAGRTPSRRGLLSVAWPSTRTHWSLDPAHCARAEHVTHLSLCRHAD